MADNGDFSINAKTGKVTSTAAMTASADANTASGAADALNVVYIPISSGLSAHVEQLEINVKNKTETSLDDLKIETTADAGQMLLRH